MPDAPFPTGMLPDIERFFREVHPTLAPGQDAYSEVFATEYFFPLQRPKELAEMIRVARKAGPPIKVGGPDDGEFTHSLGPVTVMEIGADKGGGLYHWCQCLPTVRNVIGCEIRGTPYRQEFVSAFGFSEKRSPPINFYFADRSSLETGLVGRIEHWLKYDLKESSPIDVLFIDGDKLGMLKDFDVYLPLMRRPGGVVFLHDVSDDHPARAWAAIQKRGFRTELILDRTEGIEMADQVAKGYKPRNSHEGWLAHWGGRSCGVGVVWL